MNQEKNETMNQQEQPETMEENKTQTISEDEPAVKAETETAEADDKKNKKEKKTKKDDKKECAQVQKELEIEKEKLAAAEERYMRLAAEYDNFRKRSAKELEGRYADAYADALMQLLPVIDNIERASLYQESDKVVEGIALVVKNFPDTLAKMGVEVFGEPGEAFDPNLHNAVMQVEDAEREEGQIVAVLQKGYKRGDKIIRYAMVTVAN